MIGSFFKKILLGSAIFALSLQLASAKVSASVDRAKIGAGESFTLVLHLDSFSQKPDLVPLNKDFTVYNTATSQKTTIVNGKSTSSYDMNITLMPTEGGELTIPSLSVGNEKTDPIRISVGKSLTNKEENKYSDVFVTGGIDPHTAYVNQPVLYTIKIYYSKPLAGLQLKPFEIKGADIRETGHNARYQKTINGKLYDVIEQSFLIIPERTGELYIPAITFELKVAQGFGMGGFKTNYSATKSMRLRVKPIPESIDIDDWLPATSVELKDDWSKEKGLRTGDLVTRTITLKADGVLSSDLPTLDFANTDQFNVYAEKPKLDDMEVNGHVVGVATYKIGYVPTKQGFMQIPELSVPWYNIKIHKAENASIKSRTFSVEEGQTAIPTAISSAEPQIITKEVIKEVENGKWKKMAIIFMALWLVTLLMLIMVVFQKKNHKAVKVEKEPKVKAKKSKGLSAVKKACKKKDVFMLKEAVLSWAEERYKEQVFSIMDIPNYNPDLTGILYQLNEAVYSGAKFTTFDELYTQIAQANKKTKKSKKDTAIKGLYD